MLDQMQQYNEEESEIMNFMVIEVAMVMDFMDISDEPQGRGSRYSTFVKIISNHATQSQKLFAKKHEAYRKDIDRCFGILQSRWAILRHGARMHKCSTLRSIMMTCIILHNMIVEDEFVENEFLELVEEDLMNPSASQVYDGPVDCNGVRIPFTPVQRDGRNQQAFWDRIENFESAYVHTILQNDLVEHNWAMEANE
ncbi:uncharacterized protein LOC141659176 [Apium graveolens]|uniref:uncharacterized protein LOC141659176 n=1 Tax=Apium graveolens TaxID=4045 RepID=UPI003D79096A